MRAFTIIDAEQRSPEWFASRAGRLTGSVASDVLATLKSGGEPASRRDLRTKLALERIVGRSLEDDYQNADMKRGLELEPEARAAYEAATGQLVQTTGFLSHTGLMMGCSLDGHLGDFIGVWECKCPRPANHWKYLKAGVVPAEHKAQLVHNLFVTGAEFAEFCSYCPDFPDPLRLFRVVMVRSQTDIDAYLLMAKQFLREVDEEQAEILARAAVRA